MRRTFGARRSTVLNEDMALQITSMADVFMILLVFLLKTYSAGVSSITPPQGMKLPVAVQSERIVEALKVEISESWVRLDGQAVLTMTDYKFNAGDLGTGGSVKPLQDGFAKHMEGRPADQPNQLLVLADQRTPYAVLKTVLNTAALTGWKEYKLVVVEDK
jgi:biopolymer transport protein ExbD